MDKNLRKGGTNRSTNTTRYDAHHTVLSKTYGTLADLRRELSDSKTAVAERTEILNVFANCNDSQRAWLLLEDYFEKLSLSRKDFSSHDWWPRLMAVQGGKRLEETAILFLRSNRPLPTELQAHANLARFSEIEHAEKEQELAKHLEQWLFPSAPIHLDLPRASLKVIAEPVPVEEDSALHGLSVKFHVLRPRTGEKIKTMGEVIDLTTRAAHEQELFSPADWDFIQWLSKTHADPEGLWDSLLLKGQQLLQWLVRWGDKARLELPSSNTPLVFHGRLAELKPHLETVNNELFFTQQIQLADGACHPLSTAKFFAVEPAIALVGDTFYLLRNAPPAELLNTWAQTHSIAASKLSHRMLTHLRRTRSENGVDWEQLCVVHSAIPRFTFELEDEVVRLRLLARSERDQSLWQWNGHEWQATQSAPRAEGKPEILDDPRLDPAIRWLRRLDWFTPEPGMWVGDANEEFLGILAGAWPERPQQAEYLGNPAFHRLFLNSRPLRPRLAIKGSGIDWFSISAEWQSEGMKLTAADLQRLQTATGRFVKLPDAGWTELDAAMVQAAHETLADLGVDGLIAVPQQLHLQQAAHLDEAGLAKFGDSAQAQGLRKSLAEFSGIPPTELPKTLTADLRPYQKDGFDFLAHLTRHSLGGILADDMGLGKTLQALAWLSWMRARAAIPKPALVICPASVLHNWRREANRFTPELKVLVLESGSARHNLRKQIPQYDIIVTNYALLRRDLEALQKYAFRAVVLDEAQFIKNPDAQITQSVKQLRCRSAPRPDRHAAGKPPAGPLEHCGFRPALLLGQPAEILSKNTSLAEKRSMTSSALPGAVFPPSFAPCSCAVSRMKSPAICPTASNSAETANWAKPSASSTWPNCAAAANRSSKPSRNKALTRAPCTCSPPSPACVKSVAIPSLWAMTRPPVKRKPSLSSWSLCSRKTKKFWSSASSSRCSASWKKNASPGRFPPTC